MNNRKMTVFATTRLKRTDGQSRNITTYGSRRSLATNMPSTASPAFCLTRTALITTAMTEPATWNRPPKRGTMAQYRLGKHLKKNIPKAIALLEQAAQMGNPFVEYRLAKIYPFESDYFDWHEHGSTQGQRKRLPGIAEYEPQSCFSITTRIADLIGDLSAMFDKRPAVKDCTTMPQRKERKKYEYEQCM